MFGASERPKREDIVLDKIKKNKFEYLTIKNYLDNEALNKLGLDGWELVSHTAIYVSKTHELKQNYIFKREI